MFFRNLVRLFVRLFVRASFPPKLVIVRMEGHRNVKLREIFSVAHVPYLLYTWYNFWTERSRASVTLQISLKLRHEIVVFFIIFIGVYCQTYNDAFEFVIVAQKNC